jgi:hypothetical protein
MSAAHNSLKVISTLMVLDTMTPEERMVVYRSLGFQINGVNIWSHGLPKEQRWLTYLVCDEKHIPFAEWQSMVQIWLPILASTCGGLITHDDGLNVFTHSTQPQPSADAYIEIASDENGTVAHAKTKDEFFESMDNRRVRTWHHDGVDVMSRLLPAW